MDLKPRDIARSAKNGCIKCKLLVSGFAHFDHDLGSLNETHKVEAWNGYQGDSLKVELREWENMSARLEFYSLASKSTR